MDWMIYVDKLLNNLISFFNPSWQQVILVLGIYFLCRFRANISEILLRRRMKVELSQQGLSVEVGQVAPPNTIEDVQNKIEQISTPANPIKTIENSEELIKNYLSKQKLNEHGKIELLIKNLAEVSFYSRCQGVYNIIFGSQIHLLKWLNSMRSTGIDNVNVKNYFQQIAKQFPIPFDKWTFDNYINFLLQAQLVELKNDVFHITFFGVDFLMWLSRAGMSEVKAL